MPQKLMEGYQFFLAGLDGVKPYMMFRGHRKPRVTLDKSINHCQFKFSKWTAVEITFEDYFNFILDTCSN